MIATTIHHWARDARRIRHGTTMAETFVALTLLTTVLSVSAPLVVRHNQLLASHRHYRLALDELSNQLERLTGLSADELATELAQLEPSPFTADRLPGAELRGELTPANVGQRLTLRLTWGGERRQSPPVELAAWVFPEAVPATHETGGDTP